MARIKPPAVSQGATIMVVASSSPVYESSRVNRAVSQLEGIGFRVRLGASARARRGYTAGTPAQRAADLHAAFADGTVDAVLQLRGGYGAAQVLGRLDHDLLRAHPKPLIGMSDTTMLHAAVGRHAGLVTFWGPTLTVLARADPFTVASFMAALAGACGPVPRDPDDPWVETITPGVAEGELVGGTTTLLAATLGTPDEIDTDGRIVFLEDVGEEPYRIDRALTQLAAAGKLAAAAGLVFGEHLGVEPRRFEPSFPAAAGTLEDVLADVVAPLGVPAIYGLPLGHGRHLATVPLGVPARLDAHAGVLEVLEPGVTPAAAR